MGWAHRVGQEVLEDLRPGEFWQQDEREQHSPAGLDSPCVVQTG